jgi:glycosyltransferase involved in cell wall biosynthesis
MPADAELSVDAAPLQTAVPVSAVVCVRNREHQIGRCLKSVAAARPAETIVIDGLSTDGTADIARRCGVMVVSDGGRGLGAARSLGAQLSHQDNVVFVDGDVLIEPDTLAALLTEADAMGFDALQARLQDLPGPLTYWQAGEIWRRRSQERPGIAKALGCQATLIRRELLLRVKFDPAFEGAAEDHDFFFRACAADASIGHSATAVAYHEDRATFIEFVRQRFWYGRGMTRLAVRHHALANQLGSATRAMHREPQHVPFMAISWSVTALGMAAETVALAFNGCLRRQLRRPQ